MKAKLVFCFLLSPFCLKAQITKFTVKGVVADTAGARYAYLTSLLRRTALSSNQYFQMVPIKNGKFEFSGTVDLKGKPNQYGMLIIHRRGNISKKDMESKLDNFLWPSRGTSDYKELILENMVLSIPSATQVKKARVIAGGAFTALDDAYADTYADGMKDLVALMRAHPDDLASLNMVANNVAGFSYRDTIKTYWGTPLTLFNLLSDRLKNSKEGKALKMRLDNDSKL